MSQFEITEKLKDQFNVDGVVVLRGLFIHLIDLIAEAVEQILESPGPLQLKICCQMKPDGF